MLSTAGVEHAKRVWEVESGWDRERDVYRNPTSYPHPRLRGFPRWRETEETGNIKNSLVAGIRGLGRSVWLPGIRISLKYYAGTCQGRSSCCPARPAPVPAVLGTLTWIIGWHYLSNATCLMRPRLFYVRFVVSRITILCYIVRHVWRQPALDK